MSIPTLVPAYGRDYKTQKEVKEDFEDNKDFVLTTFYQEAYCNKEDLVSSGIKSVVIRYNGNKKCVSIKIKSGK